MSKVIASLIEFESWFTSVCSPHVVSLYDFAYYVVSKSMQLLFIFPFRMLCLPAIIMFVKIMFALCMLMGMVV